MTEAPYIPSPDRYASGMVYRRAGRSGVLLPALSLSLMMRRFPRSLPVQSL